MNFGLETCEKSFTGRNETKSSENNDKNNQIKAIDFQKSKHYQNWFQNTQIEYSNHLNTGLVWYSNGRFAVSGCQMVWYSNVGLKTGLKKPVYGPKCIVLEWSAKSHDFTILIPDNLQMVHSCLVGSQPF